MVISDTATLGNQLLFNYRQVVRKENKLQFSFFLLRGLKAIMNAFSVLVVCSSVWCLIWSSVC